MKSPKGAQEIRVSVVIPAHNAAWCIERAVDSVLAQTTPPFELIVVNDGSTDGTKRVVEDYGDHLVLLNKPNGGPSSARNAGILQSQGEWIAFLDADDHWLPEKLERQVARIAAYPSFGFCSTRTLVEGPEGEALGCWQCPTVRTSALHSIFETTAAVAGSGSGVLARRDLLVEAGLFDETLQGLEDTDMWMRLAAISGYVCIDEPLTVISKRRDSRSGNLDGMRTSALMVMKKNRHLLEKPFRGGFWQAAYATVLADYAKWEYRSGRRLSAVAHLTEGLLRAPVRRGRLLLGLLLAMILGQRI
jgi:glycosyltransferase involved in cell wall biosynthesis